MLLAAPAATCGTSGSDAPGGDRTLAEGLGHPCSGYLKRLVGRGETRPYRSALTELPVLSEQPVCSSE